MHIFLSYATEDRSLAEQVQIALVGAGHRVFFDQQNLRPAGDYMDRIRSAVEECDVLVFLLSPDSVAPGSFALTELKYARSRWPHPKDRVLPVMVRPVPFEGIPAYLRAVTVLQPEGHLPAEVLVALASMSPAGLRPWVRRLGIAASVLGMIGAIGWYSSTIKRPQDDAADPPRTSDAPAPQLVDSYSGPRARFDIAVAPDTIAVPVRSFTAIAYRFKEVGGVGAKFETQDIRWLLPSGKVLKAEAGNRILGGSFNMPAGTEHELLDNVFLPPDVAEMAGRHDQSQVQLETTFTGMDFSDRPIRAKAVLRIGILR